MIKKRIKFSNNEKAILNLYINENKDSFRRKEIFNKLTKMKIIEHDHELTRALSNLVEKKIIGKRKKGYKEVYYELLAFQNKDQILLKIRDQELIKEFNYNDITIMPWDLSFYGLNLDFFPREKITELTKVIEKVEDSNANLLNFISKELNNQIKNKWSTLINSKMPVVHQWILWFIYTSGKIISDFSIPMDYRKTVCLIAKYMFKLEEKPEEIFNEHLLWLKEKNDIIVLIEQTIWFYFKTKLIIYTIPGIGNLEKLPYNIGLKAISEFYNIEPKSNMLTADLKLKDSFERRMHNLRESSQINSDKEFFKNKNDCSDNEFKEKYSHFLTEEQNENNLEWTSVMISRLVGWIEPTIFKLLKAPKINKKYPFRYFDSDYDDNFSFISAKILKYFNENRHKDLPNKDLLEKVLTSNIPELEQTILLSSWLGGRIDEITDLKRDCGIIIYVTILEHLGKVSDTQLAFKDEIINNIKCLPHYLKEIGISDPVIKMVLTLNQLI